MNKTDKQEFASAENVFRDALHAVAIPECSTVEELVREWSKRHYPEADVDYLAKSAFKAVEKKSQQYLLKAFLDDHLGDVTKIVAKQCKLFIDVDCEGRIIFYDGRSEEYLSRHVDELRKRLADFPPETLVGFHYANLDFDPCIDPERDDSRDDDGQPFDFDVCRVRDLTKTVA